jgi:hypothetical protein
MDTLERPPAGWFVLDVMPRGHGSLAQDWTALMVEVDPDELQNHYRAGFRTRQCWVPIPGKHSGRTSAWNALENMMATRH